MIWKVRSLKSRMKTHSFLEEIITSSNEGFKDYVFNMGVEIWNLGTTTRMTAENNDTVKQTAVLKYWPYSYKENDQISKTLHPYLWSWIQERIATTDRVKLLLGTAWCSSFLCSVGSLDAPWALNCRRRMRYRHLHRCQLRLPIGSSWFICVPFP